jgi:ribosome-binding factor A
MGQGERVQESINPYILRALIEANLESVRTNESVTCIAKLELSLDLDDAFSFKDALKLLHVKSEFSTIHHEERGVILLFLRDVKIHQAKTLLYSIKREIELTTNTIIESIGMTLLDENDTYHSLLKRLDEYFVMSKFSSKKKIFYGTKDFSFYESNHDKDVLRSIFKNTLWLKSTTCTKASP